MKYLKYILLMVVLGLALTSGRVDACTNFLISKGATTDGSVLITYSADSHVLYGELYFRPSATYPEGALMDIYEWDTGKYLGKIKQARQTFSVVGNMNEHQVAIGETTFGGRDELSDTAAIMDYGSLMYVALQRSKTAREAIKVMTDLVSEYGYYSSGESFSVSDANEVWIMEMISKGPGKKGAVWVAMRVPDGYVCAHANQARIRQFPLNDPANCLYAKDVISFARDKGWFKGSDKDFSFADTYAPLTYGALRACEGRVYAFFNRVAPSMKLSMDYVKGVEGAQPMPLFIKPDKKISAYDAMNLMRDYYQGTEWDMTKDAGAGPYGVPIRWRPMTWKIDGAEYCNERAISTQQTGFSFVAQSRAWLPAPIGGIIWFGVDDTYHTVYCPMYCGITRVPHSFAEGNGRMMEFTNSAFWVFNQVSNFAYTRWSDMIPDIQLVQKELEMKYQNFCPAVDKAAEELYKTNPDLARSFLTDYSVSQGDQAVARWQELYAHLFTKFLDGNIKTPNPGHQNPNIRQPGYSEAWYRDLIRQHGDQFKTHKLKGEPETHH